MDNFSTHVIVKSFLICGGFTFLSISIIATHAVKHISQFGKQHEISF